MSDSRMFILIIYFLNYTKIFPTLSCNTEMTMVNVKPTYNAALFLKGYPKISWA